MKWFKCVYCKELKPENLFYNDKSKKRRALEKNAFIENINPLSLYKKQNGICYICDKKFDFKDMEMDHIIPLCKNGKHETKNTKMACAKCNRSKGGKMPVGVGY